MAKTIKTVMENTVDSDAIEQVVANDAIEQVENLDEIVEVTLAEPYKNYSSIIINGVNICFTNGTAKVSNRAAKILKLNNYIE